MEFLFNNIQYSHGLTTAVAAVSFLIIMVGRYAS
jgi:hypothetical protein